MRQGIRTAIDWALVGAELAKEDDHAQVEFFKSFLKECRTFGTDYQTDIQLMSINEKLTDDEKEMMQTIGYMEGPQ